MFSMQGGGSGIEERGTVVGYAAPFPTTQSSTIRLLSAINSRIVLDSKPAFFTVMIILTISLDRFGLRLIVKVGSEFSMEHTRNCRNNVCDTRMGRLH